MGVPQAFQETIKRAYHGGSSLSFRGETGFPNSPGVQVTLETDDIVGYPPFRDPLKSNPGEYIKGVIVRSTAAEAIVIRAGPIKPVVDDVLHGELGSFPGEIIRL